VNIHQRPRLSLRVDENLELAGIACAPDGFVAFRE
jgi:hypothetical protein